MTQVAGPTGLALSFGGTATYLFTATWTDPSPTTNVDAIYVSLQARPGTTDQWRNISGDVEVALGEETYDFESSADEVAYLRYYRAIAFAGSTQSGYDASDEVTSASVDTGIAISDVFVNLGAPEVTIPTVTAEPTQNGITFVVTLTGTDGYPNGSATGVDYIVRRDDTDSWPDDPEDTTSGAIHARGDFTIHYSTVGNTASYYRRVPYFLEMATSEEPLFRVYARAKTEGNVGGWAQSATFSADLPAPTSVTVRQVSAGRVEATWPALADAGLYRVELLDGSSMAIDDTAGDPIVLETTATLARLDVPYDGNFSRTVKVKVSTVHPNGSVYNGTTSASQTITFNLTSYTSDGTYTYTVPEFAREIRVTLVGAGGGGRGGNGNSSSSDGGHGGGGGHIVEKRLVVTPGTSLTVVVGNGGTGGAGDNSSGSGRANGGDGGDTTVSYSGVTLLRAYGGNGGKTSGGAGGGILGRSSNTPSGGLGSASVDAPAEYGGGAGGTATAGVLGEGGGSSAYGAGGGGSGGGVASSTAYAGGDGGDGSAAGPLNNGSAGIIGNALLPADTPGDDASDPIYCGGGGGGGGGGTTQAGTKGRPGGNPGGGGGGGGAGGTSRAGGAGGAGGDGAAYILAL